MDDDDVDDDDKAVGPSSSLLSEGPKKLVHSAGIYCSIQNFIDKAVSSLRDSEGERESGIPFGCLNRSVPSALLALLRCSTVKKQKSDVPIFQDAPLGFSDSSFAF